MQNFPQISLFLKLKGNSKLAKIKNDHFKNTILQNFDPNRFDYSLKLFFFSNFLWAQIG